MLSSYVINNDTDSYAVVLDDRFELFRTAQETKDIRAEVFRLSGGSDYIVDTAFAFLEILPPHSGRDDGQRLSTCEPCDLRAYMTARRAEIEAIPDPVYDYTGFWGVDVW